VSKRDRRDDGRRGDRRDNQPEDEQQRRAGETDVQEGDSLIALKAILAKVAGLLKPLQLNQDESVRLVEQLYSKVLETDLQLAGETDDTRKSSVLAAIQNATVRREGGKILVDYSTVSTPAETQEPAASADAEAAAQVTKGSPAETAAAEESAQTPPTEATDDPKPPRKTTSRRTAARKPAPTQAEPPAD